MDKLKQQMVNKKEEHDILQNRSEKDLWCLDLDDFVHEWETQLKEDADYQKTIRNTNRRASRKIGAGKNIKSRKNNDDDDDFAAPKPNASKANAAKGNKVEHKSHKGFLEMFNAKPKPKSGNSMGADGTDEPLSDEDFAALGATKLASTEPSRSTSEQAANGRSKRAAAAAPKKWIVDDEESEDDDSKYLGDVGAMVKGIGSGDTTSGRVSLFAMSRPGTSHGERPSSSDLPKAKSKTNKASDFLDGDETNYEMLARSSPHKAAPAPKDTLDSFLSDEDDLMPVSAKKVIVKAAPAARASSVAPVAKAPAKRGPKPKKALAKEPTPAPQPQPVALSPAAKAYAAKKSKMDLAAKKNVFSEDEDDDMEMNDSPPPKPAAKPAAKATKAKAPAKTAVISDDDDNLEMSDSPPPKPAAGRGRPARAAVAKAKAKPIYIDSDDDEEEDFEASTVADEDEPTEDDFDDSD